MGNHARVLDVLHESNAAVVRSAGAWHGGSRILEGGVNGENTLGEIRTLEASTGIG